MFYNVLQGMTKVRNCIFAFFVFRKEHVLLEKIRFSAGPGKKKTTVTEAFVVLGNRSAPLILKIRF